MAYVTVDLGVLDYNIDLKLPIYSIFPFSVTANIFSNFLLFLWLPHNKIGKQGLGGCLVRIGMKTTVLFVKILFEKVKEQFFPVKWRKTSNWPFVVHLSWELADENIW